MSLWNLLGYKSNKLDCNMMEGEVGNFIFAEMPNNGSYGDPTHEFRINSISIRSYMPKIGVTRTFVVNNDKKCSLSADYKGGRKPFYEGCITFRKHFYDKYDKKGGSYKATANQRVKDKLKDDFNSLIIYKSDVWDNSLKRTSLNIRSTGDYPKLSISFDDVIIAADESSIELGKGCKPGLRYLYGDRIWVRGRKIHGTFGGLEIACFDGDDNKKVNEKDGILDILTLPRPIKERSVSDVVKKEMRNMRSDDGYDEWHS